MANCDDMVSNMNATFSAEKSSVRSHASVSESRTLGSRRSGFKPSLLWLLAALLAVALFAAACSSDDDASEAGTDSATSVAPAVTASTTIAPATSSAAGDPAAPNSTSVVPADASQSSETPEPPATTESVPATVVPAAETSASDPPAEVPGILAPGLELPDPLPDWVPQIPIFPISAAPGNLVLPNPLPDAPPGTLIDVEPLGEFGEISAHRILYHSRSRKGENIAVSGYVLAPLDDAADSEWPVVAYAHGTTGMADQCAPSATVDSDLRSFGGEASLLNQVAALGYVVVATDYEGLGTPGLHPYLVGESEARSILDSVRAVQQMEELNASDKFAVTGISQGGHAALHAGQYWQTYAPELDLVGVVSMAPPSQATLMYDAIINSSSKGFIYMALAAYDDAYDEVDIAEVLTPEGVELLAELENGCTEYVFNVFNQHEVSDLVSVDNPLTIPAWRDIAIDNDVNQRALPAPVFIAHGSADTLIPAVSSSLLCAQITPLPNQGPTLRKVYEGATHGGVATAAAPDIATWLAARFAGEEVEETGCG